ncbi:hypothetical protein BBOV_II005450 [Babesia bovis T2Bo]|uniref:Uncharacterized protein n=1 Tax=Babesia bovis TaxID=5865 RepID=A7AU85_BABBO|nr:hypothetical protein BBOV_II005450 [Babesia bovis T2Bo]EDO06496.1 hypothetical protein BBOV_II005450 [Babesia bovis T2Bo]|eukprot:XP_001610064.1 hypothetical protein [Babesia bovis T2Bo]
MDVFIPSVSDSPANIIRQTCVSSIKQHPDGPIAQLSYLSARVYRAVNAAMQVLQPIYEPDLTDSHGESVHRIPISAIKSEMEEFIRKNQVLETNQSFNDNGEIFSPKKDVCNVSGKGYSFDFVDADDERSTAAVSADGIEGTNDVPMMDMDQFMELLVSCANEVEMPL